MRASHRPDLAAHRRFGGDRHAGAGSAPQSLLAPALAMALFFIPTAAPAQEPPDPEGHRPARISAENGALIEMPAIADLDCAGIERTLRRLDRSNYRGIDPVPEGHPDYPIFRYEERLSAARYACILERSRLADPEAAFLHGFGRD